jgi:hypothetical protein
MAQDGIQQACRGGVVAHLPKAAVKEAHHAVVKVVRARWGDPQDKPHHVHDSLSI